MPYVPSKKTGAIDREILDPLVEKLAQRVAKKITNNLSLIRVYKNTFMGVARRIHSLTRGKEITPGIEADLARAIYSFDAKYGYEGAFLGELNYSFTRFIQRVPQIKVENGTWTEELRYWLYDRTASALLYASRHTEKWEIGIDGIFDDIKLEYKWRVNTAYEAAQIIKNRDCYDTPYYTRLIEVVDENDNHIGYLHVMLERSEATLDKDVLDYVIVLKKKENK